MANPSQAILDIAEEAMSEMHLRAVLLHVTVDGDELVHHAVGESMTGIPATADMHVRNGAVAITYMSTLLLRLVDEGVLALDDAIDRWLPELPDADQVTLRMLANMTSGYPDFVQNADFLRNNTENPFRAWTPDEQIEFGLSTPRVFAPGTNWDYSHTNYVILGLALEAATGEPLDALLRQHILDPLNLTGTASEQTAWMPDPVLHAFTSERREQLGVPAGTRFYEESTFWDPSWTLARGSVQYSTIADMTTSFAAIGRGDLLSEASYRELVNHDLLGFGAPLAGCPNCRTLDATQLYGLGIWMTGGWLLQNPLFSGYAGTTVYHPEGRIAIGVATTFAEGAFDEQGIYQNSSTTIAARIGTLLMTEDPLPGS
ncbi:MAG TPA: serine hydrolase domain-containing protein [Thermomicrobiales bacterium]|nr:serine hydrolase domain-containing protein [Thermomicrobiales bacterium]